MRFGDDREPFEMTKLSSRPIIVVCPRCFTGNQVTKTWFAGDCRECKKMFTKDNAAPLDSMSGEVLKSPEKLIDKNFTEIKGEAEKRAYEWRDEQTKLKKTGLRNNGIASSITPRIGGRPRKRK